MGAPRGSHKGSCQRRKLPEVGEGRGEEKQSESAGGPEGWGSRQVFLQPAPRGRDVAPHRQGGVGEVRGDIFALPALRHGYPRATPGRGRPLLRGPARSGFGARGDASVYTRNPETESPAPIGWWATPIRGSEQWDPWTCRLLRLCPATKSFRINTCKNGSWLCMLTRPHCS